MSSDYWTWIGWSIGSSAIILVVTLAVLCLMLFQCDSIFYGIVAQLLSIERCYIDAHHNLIRKDQKLDLSAEALEKLLLQHTQTIAAVVGTLQGKSEDSSSQAPALSEQPAVNENDTGKEVQNTKAHANYERQVLNLYGRYIPVYKRGTVFFVMTLVTIILSGALIAAFNSLFLSLTSVYRGGPCPSIGTMDCFCGYNQTYFVCTPGQNNACPLDEDVSSCFRWIARDITTSDVTTQLGVTTGLLLAFGNITRAIIQIYLLAFRRRLNLATAIHRMAGKTIGINRHTARTQCCCCRLPWHCSPCNLSLFKNPATMIIVTIVYIAVPILMIPGVAMLYHYHLSVTSLTFVILIVVAIACVLAIVWIMVQDNEASSNIPGGWGDMKQLAGGIVSNAQNAQNIGTGAGKV